jgi:hypothetical protein
MPEYFSKEISQAVLYTIMYSDVFDYPLTAHEVHHFLHRVSATYEQVVQALNEIPGVTTKDSYYILTGREAIVSVRKERESLSRQLIPYAMKYGHILGRLPFVRMVALTGSLAVMNVSRNADFDYMLVTAPGRLWTARAFVLLFGRLTKYLGHTICPNLLVSQNALEWNQHDLYSARELCQMIPITGKDVYKELMTTNGWVQRVLPNAYRQRVQAADSARQNHRYLFQAILEFLLQRKFGERLENWEMARKVARFSKQDGFGEETLFNTEICQGNFDHHRKRTQQALGHRLKMEELAETTL